MNNSLDPEILVADFPNIRSVSQITSQLNGTGYEQAVDYEKIEMQKIAAQYSFDPGPGFMSLNPA